MTTGEPDAPPTASSDKGFTGSVDQPTGYAQLTCMQQGKSLPENCQISPGGYNSWRQLAIQSLGGEEGEDGDHRHQTINDLLK